MRKFEFKKLELEPEASGFKHRFQLQKLKKTAIYMLIGGLLGFAFYYFSEGMSANQLWNPKSKEFVFFGMLIGIFITNSPCAKGSC